MKLPKFINRIFAFSIVGSIPNPLENSYGAFDNQSGGIIGLLSNLLRIVFVVAGVWSLFNLIVAGFMYMNSGGDAKKLTEAWSKIWLTLVGLIIIIGSFAMAGVVGYLFFNDPTYILNPKIYGPGN